jgi:hypothetical protein
MFTDIMIDTETTGTVPEHCAMFQLVGVKFNLLTREVSPDVFDEALGFAPNRYWQEGGRSFWQKMPNEYKEFVARAKDPGKVMQEFVAWVGKDQPDGGYRFWSKPLSFDWPFVEGYCRQYGIEMPFFYRVARDVNSYVSGLRGDPEHFDLDDVVPFEGQKHNALWDAFHQINMLFYAQDKWSPVNV